MPPSTNVCPTCDRAMGAMPEESDGLSFRCPACLGSWIPGETIGQYSCDGKTVADFLATGFLSLGSGTCPGCGARLQRFEFLHARGRQQISYCSICTGFWIPSGGLILFQRQWKRAKAKPAPPPIRRLDQPRPRPSAHVPEPRSPDKAAASARKQKRGVPPRMRDGITTWHSPTPGQLTENSVVEFYRDYPYEDLKTKKAGWGSCAFSFLLGLPLKWNHPCFYDSWVLFLVMLTLTFASVYTAELFLSEPTLKGLFLTFGANPAHTGWEAIRGLFTFSFIHGSLFHMLVNVYFLWLFGSNIIDLFEARGTFSGWFTFILFMCLMAMISGLTHILLGGAKPVIGASGMTSALMGAYWRVFPRAILFFVFFLVPVEQTCGLYFLQFLFRNLVIAYLFFFESMPTYVSWQAHLGGFVAGYLLIPLFLPCPLAALHEKPART